MTAATSTSATMHTPMVAAKRSVKVEKALSMPEFHIGGVSGCESNSVSGFSKPGISTTTTKTSTTLISVHSSSAPSLRSIRQGKSINLPKIKNKESPNLTTSNMSNPASRILVTIAQILDEVGAVVDDLFVSDIYSQNGSNTACNITLTYPEKKDCKNDTPISHKSESHNSTVALLLNDSTVSIESGCLASSLPASDPAYTSLEFTKAPNSNYSSNMIVSDKTSQLKTPSNTIQVSKSGIYDTELEKAFQNLSISTESKRKIIRQCLDLKRLVDKEGSSIFTDSLVQKAIFSKSSINISVLFRCLQNAPDIDLSIVITSMLIRLATLTECNQTNILIMSKKNLAAVLMRCLQFYHQQYIVPTASPISPNLSQRLDEVLVNILTLLCKLAKYDSKLSLLARLHNAIPISIDIIQKWLSRKDYHPMLLAFTTLRVFLAKNDSLLPIVHRSNIIQISEQLLKSTPSQIAQAKLDSVVDLLALLAKPRAICIDILRIFDIKYILTLVNSPYDGVQRASLKLLKATIDHDFAKRLFLAADGAKILTDILHTVLHTYEGASTALSSTNSTPALMVAVLRAAVAHSDLPFFIKFHDRAFPLPVVQQDVDKPIDAALTSSKKHALLNSNANDGIEIKPPHSSQPSDMDLLTDTIKKSSNHVSLMSDQDYSHAVDTYTTAVREVDTCFIPPTQPGTFKKLDLDTDTLSRQSIFNDKAIKNPNEDVNQDATNLELADEMVPISPSDKLIAKLSECCPELLVVASLPVTTNELPAPNIRVRHVQPMSSGKHTICRSICPVDLEPQTRRTPLGLRKTIFEHTVKMLQVPTQGTLIYDVMQEQVSQNIASLDDDTLIFDSRFESGNLQMAIKISQFEYDLILQTDINAQRGKHNQKMIPNVPYKFNILNMSKPASQFNHGMQPVVYSVANPGWRRAGEGVFYIKNHYRKSHDVASTESSVSAADTTSGTYSTLVFSLLFKNLNDTCYIAYHYPYTYSELQRSLYQYYQNPRYRMHCRRTSLCQTLGGNECILLTITDFQPELLVEFPMKDRKYVFLSARVHPGESNSSHIMSGLIQFLLGVDDAAVILRRKCIFKIIPMLNPDGVINGSFLAIFMGILAEKTYFYLDAKMVQVKQKDTKKYTVEKSKESTARIVLWREFGVVNSFTLESSHCGADFGERKGAQFSIADLERMGMDFCRGLLTLTESKEFKGLEMPISLPELNHDMQLSNQNDKHAFTANDADNSIDQEPRLKGKSAVSASSSTVSTPSRPRKKTGSNSFGTKIKQKSGLYASDNTGIVSAVLSEPNSVTKYSAKFNQTKTKSLKKNLLSARNGSSFIRTPNLRKIAASNNTKQSPNTIEQALHRGFSSVNDVNVDTVGDDMLGENANDDASDNSSSSEG
ncbi:cytosolic carboxypeptidase 2 [Batrachochytrium dendrobatidis JEL423]|uniref:tubulin-glutamate carboxypeptidase n=1 Tax=Batrachochytrium dendrobatidis (strain JEL423) TaxID=403673 RepID=A0A177W8H0_BATDL|nr:cytosolic carboxypeptidase 2 [Batrachochytrium dendrobatidis JEL423]